MSLPATKLIGGLPYLAEPCPVCGKLAATHGTIHGATISCGCAVGRDFDAEREPAPAARRLAQRLLPLGGDVSHFPAPAAETGFHHHGRGS